MASLPSRSQRTRSSPGETAASPPAQEVTDHSSQAPTQETQSFLLNPRPAELPSSSSTTGTKPQNPEPKTCWICQQDDTDDTPESSTWRTPCPCSLTAHDSCLIEWIANEEAPKPGEIAQNRLIKCPQCQAEIKIERPRADIIVAAMENIHRAATNLVLPTALSAVVGCFYSGLLVYGANTMQVVFGSDEATRLLGTIARYSASDLQYLNFFKDMVAKPLSMFNPFFPDHGNRPNIKIFLGLPLIGPALIVSRTRSADQTFALLLPIYFLEPSHRTDLLQWPPSPGLAFAVVPYLRTLYYELYRRTFGNLEKKWDLAVQRKPREGETAEDIAAAQADDQEGEGRAIFELEIVHEHVHQDEINEAPRQRQEEVNAGAEDQIDNRVPAAVDRVEADAAVLDPEVAGARAAVEAAANRVNEIGGNNDNGNGEFRRGISANQLASTVIGALFFPTVSAAMGHLLKVALPAKWVGNKNLTFRIVDKSNGLLKERWGRTLVGGCLFVVLKDVITLYCKWKKARDFGKRRVLDYVGKNGTEA